MKFEITRCRNPECEKSFRKRRLGQRFCHESCRKFAYDRRAGRVSTDPRYVRKRLIQAQKNVGKAFPYSDSGNRQLSAEKAKKNSALQRAISQSTLLPSRTSWPIDIVGGKGGSNRLPPALYDAIVSTELRISEPDDGAGE